jgi:hypothetical protein
MAGRTGGPLTRVGTGRGGPGRSERPPTDPLDRPSRPPADPELPPELADRFEVAGSPVQGGEATVWRVRDRGGQQHDDLALKLYYPGIKPDPVVARRLDTIESVHLLNVKTGQTDDGRYYELMEYLPGRTLARILRHYPDGMPAPVIREIVEQLADTLTRLHDQRIVHLDVKPDNIAIRGNFGAPGMEVVLIDFGSAKCLRTDQVVEDLRDPPRTTLYAAPEIFLDKVGRSSDWWSLGMTVAELSAGHHPLEGMREQSIRFQVVIDDEVPIAAALNPEVQLLCEGLLARQPVHRWGTGQVHKWLAHEPVAPPTQQGPARETINRAVFTFAGEEYRDRVPLAVALTAHWTMAADELFRATPGRWPDLCAWLKHFDGTGNRETSADLAFRLEQPGLQPDAALLILLRWLHPGGDAVYLGWNVGLAQLPRLAATAADAAATSAADQNAVQVVNDLWNHELLRHLDGARGGRGFAAVDERWRTFTDDWDRAARRIGAADPELDAVLGTWQGAALRAWLLWLATDHAKDAQVRSWLERIRQDVRRDLGGPPARLDWFEDLVNSAVTPAARLATYAVSGIARRAAARVREQRNEQFRDQRRRDVLWRQLETVRQWDRSVALGWASGATAIVTVGWFILLQITGQFAMPAQVTRAWLYTSCAAIVQIVIELTIAAAIGGPYHPRYSLMTYIYRAAGRAGRIGMTGRIGRLLARTGRVASYLAAVIALVAAAAVVAPAVEVTRYVPFLLPVIAVSAHLIDARSRYRRWRSYYEHRRNTILNGLENEAIPRETTDA